MFSPEELEQEIAQLETDRNAVAQLRSEVAERELGARLLRLEIECTLRAGRKDAAGNWLASPVTKTDAEKEAKAAPEYVDYERQTIGLSVSLAAREAVAECRRLRILASIPAEALLR